MNKINSFRDEYYFLSNFYECYVTYNGLTYKNNECQERITIRTR